MVGINKDFLTNPLMGMGIGLIQGGASGAQQGLQNMMLMQQANSRNQLMQLQSQKYISDQKALEKQRGIVQGLAGRVEQAGTSSQPLPQGIAGPPEQVISQEAQQQADLIRTFPGEYASAQFRAPTKQANPFEIGLPEGQRTKAIWGPDGQPVPVGSPYEASAAVNIDMGVKSAKPTDLQKLVNDKGQWPAHLVGLPTGTAFAQAQKEGYNPVTTAGEKMQASEKLSGGIISELKALTVGEGGIYEDYGAPEWTAQLPESLQGVADKVWQTGKGNFEYLAQNDPRFKAYADFAKGTASPIVKLLGEVGTLAEGDIQRALGLLPEVTGFNIDTPEVAATKIFRLEQLLTSAEDGTLTPEDLNKTWVQDGRTFRQLKDGTIQRLKE